MQASLPSLKKLLLLVFFINSCNFCFAASRYVKTGGAGTAPYTSWATASNDLQAVINACSSGDEIWIATGTYKPNRRADALTVITVTDRNNAFVLKNGVKIYGGFTGVETLLSQRNSTVNVATLSGDINTAGVTTDNCYHVVISSGNNNATLLDGVQVTTGYANGSAVATITVNTRTIVPNRGGGIYAAASSAVFDECTIRRNNTTGNGAGLYDTLSAVIAISNCTLTQNIADNNGGGIYNASSSPGITSCDIIQNEAGNHGGGIYNTGSSPDITNCDIEQNEAVNNGGGIYNTSSTPVLSNNNIADNEAGNNGGGIFNTGSSNDITAGFVTGNIAGNNGGGVFNGGSSDGSISNIKILNNAAVNGGAMYNNNSSPLVSGCAFHDNTASASGGASYNNNADAVEFDNCAFKSNIAVINGGALYFSTSTAPEVKHCNLQGNIASGNGGGFYLTGSDAAVVNCLLNGNTAVNGAAVYNTSSAPDFINCTAAANKATGSGGGFYNVTSSSLVIQNSILWGNTASVGGNNIFNASSLSVTYSNVGGGTSGTGNINSNPLFVAPEPASAAPTTVGNYRVQKCSPVINAGDNSLIPPGITEDIAGDNRINYAIVDMGAYEKTLAVKAASGIVYVDHTKNGDGSEWSKAVPSLADALITAKYNTAITEIWVAKGTYYPEYNATNLASLVCNAGNRDNAFVLVNNVKVYGGFINGAASLAERDPENNSTILNGDINGDNTSTGNTYHVVISSNAVGTAILDGFTITKGNANGTGSVFVNSIDIFDYRGGGIAISSSYPRISNCRLVDNYGENGGAMSIISSSPVIFNCIFWGNTAGIYGGAIDNYKLTATASSPVITNCMFTGNKSLAFGGAFVNSLPNVLNINNCTVAGNYAASQGGGFWNGGTASESIRNSIVWGNRVGAVVNNIYNGSGISTVTYSNIEAGYPGTANINADPLFISPQPASAAPTALGDYHLQKCSPAINVGSNALVPAGITKDLDSSSRISLLTVDMGAYEKHLVKPDANGIVYVDSSNTAVIGDGSSWTEAVTEVADAIKEAKTNTDIKEIWVAKGTYKPIYNAADAYLNSICHTTDRDAAFVLVPNVKLYGGFAGGETNLSQRNIVINKTVLNCDIGTAGNAVDNCYHVVISAGAVGTASLDGFSIINGNASDLLNTTVNSNSVSASVGGGICIKNSSPLIANCSLHYNTGRNATAISISNSQPLVSACIISGNTSTAGSIIETSYSDNTLFANCLIAGNAVVGNLITSTSSSNVTFSSTTIAANSVTLNIFYLQSLCLSPCYFLNNSIVWGNSPAANFYSYSAPPGAMGAFESNYSIPLGAFGTGSIYMNPLFVNPLSPSAAPTILGDYRLQVCSPAINRGSNALLPPGITKDLDSLDRIQYATVDMGAYEIHTVDFANATWKGENVNWNDPVNWCGGYIPTDTTNVIIPNTTSDPRIYAGYDNEVKNFSLASSTTITVDNTAKLTINGTYTNSGSTIYNRGDWVMAGNAPGQTFPGTLATVAAMNNLEVNNSGGLKFNKSFQLNGTLTPTAGNINVDNATITLNSDATSTARVAEVPSSVAFSYTGTGRFSIQRYIPPHRAWRLLTAPVSSATNPTISEAWQNGLSNADRLSPIIGTPGLGTTITKSTIYNAADGYDQGSTNNPSIRYYNGTSWGGFPSSTIGTTPGANNGLINDKQGYMLFVRGDRSIVVAGTGVTATVTTLRPRGQLKVGPQTINCTGWTVIGNPYASPINFHKIVEDNPGLPDVFYVWDANLAGSNNVGGWVSYSSYSAGTQTYTVAPLLSGSTFANNKGDISSGSAFMVNYTGNITINENHKSTLGDNVLYRPVRQLSMNLYLINTDSTESLNDGLAIKFDESPRAANAEKNKNFTENLAIAFDNKLYAIQNRRKPHFNDTIFISTGQMKQRSYVMEIKADELNIPNRMKAYLEDTYLHYHQPVALEGSTRYAFTVNADSASISSARFRLLFKKSAKFAQIHAAAKENDIEVQWKMEENFGIAHYEIERSVNGTDFTIMTKQLANKHQQSILQNQWLDVSPSAGTYYYRIKVTGIDGEVLYSDIAKAGMVNNGAGMYVYPNPVTGKTLQLRMNHQPGGQYNAAFINNNGQKIFTQKWQHSGGFVTKTFELPAVIAAGMYQLEVTNAKGKKEVLTVEVQQ